MEIEESIMAICGLLLVMIAMRDVAWWHSHHSRHVERVSHHHPHHPKNSRRKPKGRL
jgi:hypothetical protein